MNLKVNFLLRKISSVNIPDNPKLITLRGTYIYGANQETQIMRVRVFEDEEALRFLLPLGNDEMLESVDGVTNGSVQSPPIRRTVSRTSLCTSLGRAK